MLKEGDAQVAISSAARFGQLNVIKYVISDLSEDKKEAALNLTLNKVIKYQQAGTYVDLLALGATLKPEHLSTILPLLASKGDLDGIKAIFKKSGAADNKAQLYKKHVKPFLTKRSITTDRSTIEKFDAAMKYGSGINQQEYSRLVNASVDKISANLEKGTFTLAAKKADSSDIDLEWLGFQRQHIARVANSEHAELFGVPRGEGRFYTTIGPYGSYDSYLHYLDVDQEPGKTQMNLLSNAEVVEVRDENHFMLGTIIARIGHHNIELTSIRKGANNYIEWSHTPIRNVPIVLEHVDKLMKQCLSKKYTSQEALLKDVGEIHWWLSHAAPYKRGSAAISEMLVASLLKSHGYDMPKYKPNHMPDCVALCTPDRDSYKKNYHTLLDGKLKSIKAKVKDYNKVEKALLGKVVTKAMARKGTRPQQTKISASTVRIR